MTAIATETFSRNGLQWTLTAYPDDATTIDESMHPDREVYAFRHDDWRFVGIVITAEFTAASYGELTRLTVAAEVWGCQYGNVTGSGNILLSHLRHNPVIVERMGEMTNRLRAFHSALTTVVEALPAA